MKKSYTIILFACLCSTICFSQQKVGVNETNPQGEFHVSAPYDFQGMSFTGSGTDDLTAKVTSFGGTTEITYTVSVKNAQEIPNLYDWSDSAGGSGTAVPMSHPNTLSNGLKIFWGSTSGHVLGDTWTFTIGPSFLDGLIVREGKVGIGKTNPSQTLDVNGSIRIGEGTSTPSAGTLKWNSTQNVFQGYNGLNWNNLISHWTSTSGGIYNNTKVGVGTGGDFFGKFNVSSTLERTAMDIRNFYQGSEVSRGIQVFLSQNTSSQYGISSSVSPNDNSLLPAIAFSASMSTVGGIANKPVIAYDAYLPPSLLGTKYGLRVYAPGSGNWAAHLDGRTFMSDRTYIGDIGSVEAGSWGALTIHNDAAISKFASLHLRNTASNNTYYGLYNNFTASTSLGANYGSQLNVTGGAVGKPIFGSFISLGAATGDKTGLYVNAPGATNWAGYFNGRSYISEELLVGTTTGAAGYRLSVDGKIACEEVRVELNEAWPDYVFKEDYKLRSIAELEQSINENGHLPGIPSADDIKENGLEVGDMQKQMMEKLEELTLYIIDLNKENSELKSRVSKLEQSKK